MALYKSALICARRAARARATLSAREGAQRSRGRGPGLSTGCCTAQAAPHPGPFTTLRLIPLCTELALAPRQAAGPAADSRLRVGAVSHAPPVCSAGLSARRAQCPQHPSRSVSEPAAPAGHGAALPAGSLGKGPEPPASSKAAGRGASGGRGLWTRAGAGPAGSLLSPRFQRGAFRRRLPVSAAARGGGGSGAAERGIDASCAAAAAVAGWQPARRAAAPAAGGRTVERRDTPGPVSGRLVESESRSSLECCDHSSWG